MPLSTAMRLPMRRTVDFSRPTHVFIAIADHYEPMWLRPAASVQQERVTRWATEYPRVFAGVTDSIGRPPQHTFFWPADEYAPEHVDPIADLCRKGYGDIEIHLHHDNDSSQCLRDTLERFAETLHNRHGMLARDSAGRLTYGFVHGNWALDNSRPDGRWCGVNDELTILRETGCYADFTMPCAPDPAQTKTVNSIYYAVDDPQLPKSHDTGVPARVGLTAPQHSLLMIQGPLAWNWRSRKSGLLPRLENGNLGVGQPPTLDRFQLWCAAGVHVAGREDWLFLKLHTHGAQETNASILLGEANVAFHRSLKAFAKRHPQLRYYYVTAREMAGLVHQATMGMVEPDVHAISDRPGAQRHARQRDSAPSRLK